MPASITPLFTITRTSIPETLVLNPIQNPIPSAKTYLFWKWDVADNTLALLWLGSVVVTFSNAGANPLIWLTLVAFGALLATSAMLRLAIKLWRLKWGDVSGLIRTLTLWSLTPIIGFVGLVSIKTDFDLMLRTRLSETDLIAVTNQVSAKPDRGYHDLKAGFFTVLDAYPAENVVLLVTSYPALAGFDEAGLTYAPNGLPPTLARFPYDTTHLYGPWYTFYFHE